MARQKRIAEIRMNLDSARFKLHQQGRAKYMKKELFIPAAISTKRSVLILARNVHSACAGFVLRHPEIIVPWN